MGRQLELCMHDELIDEMRGRVGTEGVDWSMNDVVEEEEEADQFYREERKISDFNTKQNPNSVQIIWRSP